MITKVSDSFSTYLPTGCRLCHKGAKMVLFITGLCQKDCFYCPVSDQRRNKDVIFINERPVESDENILQEANSMNALGTGITGGEPLLVLQRVLDCIRLLKKNLGRSHHIHMYTAQSPDKVILQDLKSAGLDEIRFHPPQHLWDRMAHSTFAGSITWAKQLGMKVGLEIPCIHKANCIVPFARECNIFLNLNELEFSVTNATALKERGYSLLDDELSSAAGSRDIGLDIMEQYPNVQFNFCSSGFKDTVQLRKRLLRTADIIARTFDETTQDGTLYYGVITGDIEEIINLMRHLGVPEDLYSPIGSRVELGWWVLEDIAKKVIDRFESYYEECYPTYGKMVVERVPLTIDSMNIK